MYVVGFIIIGTNNTNCKAQGLNITLCIYVGNRHGLTGLHHGDMTNTLVPVLKSFSITGSQHLDSVSAVVLSGGWEIHPAYHTVVVYSTPKNVQCTLKHVATKLLPILQDMHAVQYALGNMLALYHSLKMPCHTFDSKASHDTALLRL